MKIYYVREASFVIGAKCLNCDEMFSITSQGAYFHVLQVDGKDVKVLFCPKCKDLDIYKVQKEISSGAKLERMNPSEEEQQ